MQDSRRESQKRHTHTGYDGGKAFVTGACHQTGGLAEGHRQSVSKNSPLAQLELRARVLNQLRKEWTDFIEGEESPRACDNRVARVTTCLDKHLPYRGPV